MNTYTADLHIHTCLSPCSEWEMSPRRIAEVCRRKHIDIIAVCDHNSAENAGAVMQAGKDKEILVLPGMEVCSKEEVHILTIFERLEQANTMQEYVYDHLKGENNPELFGYQVVALETDEVVSESSKLLIGATQLSVQDIADKAHALDGLCVASHVDRRTYGIIGQLGFIPPDLHLDAIEISTHMSLEEARIKLQGIDRWPVITSSDAHSPENIGTSVTEFVMHAPTFEELCLAINGVDGRKVHV